MDSNHLEDYGLALESPLGICLALVRLLEAFLHRLVLGCEICPMKKSVSVYYQAIVVMNT